MILPFAEHLSSIIYKTLSLVLSQPRCTRLPPDLLAAAVLSLAALFFTLTRRSDISVVRVPLGLLMVLFVPSYTLIAALFPRREDLEGKPTTIPPACSPGAAAL
jgi:uncharacterized membrane protein